jgi:MoaE-MoaD fusion protein
MSPQRTSDPGAQRQPSDEDGDGGSGETMSVSVRLFAMLRERAGSTIELELPLGARVSDALRLLCDSRELRDVLPRLPVAMAVNREYADLQSELRSGDELALIPPLSGG